MKNEINEKSYISIIKIAGYDFIPELKVYGPVGKRMARVDQIINMLNRGVDVIISKENNEKLYLFIKQYNLYVDTIKGFKKLEKATLAEEILYKRLFKTAMEEEEKEKEENPLIDSITKDDVKKIENIFTESDIEQLVNTKKIKRKRIKVHEIFSDAEISENISDNKFNNIELKN